MLDITAHRLRKRVVPVVQQNEIAECGLACVAMIACYHGHELDLASMRRRFPLSIGGATLAHLITIAGHLDMDARALRVELDGLATIRTPVILHWDLNHFVVLERLTRKCARIHDPARGALTISKAELGRHFTGVVLELSPRPDFSPKSEKQDLSVGRLLGRISGAKRAFAQIAALAFALELFTLALPLFMQLVVDHALIAPDYNLLALMGVGFLGIVVAQASFAFMRGWAIAHLGASLNSQWLTNLFGHLLRLPLEYFQKRSIGGVLSRFMSIKFVQQTLTGSFIEAVLDGFAALLVIGLLVLYSPSLMAISIIAVVLYIIVRWAAYRYLARLTEEQLVYVAKQQTELIEAIHGIQTIKLANKESRCRSRVENAAIEVAYREAAIGRNAAIFGALSKLIFGVQRIVLIWAAALMVLSGRLTAGMLVVAVVYGDLFVTRISGLVDKIVEFGLLHVHAARVADVALEPVESGFAMGGGALPEDASLEFRSITFRYADGAPWLMRDCSFRIEEGESVAIIGQSGCGKTTLAKILLGLLKPDAGEVLLGGIEIGKVGLSGYRENIATVMQEDALFAGSIADNIAFFDVGADPKDIVENARAAQIHGEIVAMPMGYESLVGDMGSALSGGQKQRVLLARALYRKPKILLLDEATSHLDVETERRVNHELSKLRLTRIVLAHRLDTILNADRVLKLSDGKVTEVSKTELQQNLVNSRASAVDTLLTA